MPGFTPGALRFSAAKKRRPQKRIAALAAGANMTGTYHISANAYMRKRLLQSERMASLLIDVLFHYRDERRFALHAFVVMPDHFHALITLAPGVTIERAMQFIKGGFSYRAKKEFGVTWKIWQPDTTTTACVRELSSTIQSNTFS